jgi:hypothetical protein
VGEQLFGVALGRVGRHSGGGRGHGSSSRLMAA